MTSWTLASARLPLARSRARSERSISSRPTVRYAFLGGVTVFGAAAVSLLVADRRPGYAVLVALAPLGGVLFGRTRAIYIGLLMPVLATTLVLGRFFSELAIGPTYVLDTTLVLALMFTAPAIVASAMRFPAATALLLTFIGITAAEVAGAGTSRVVLRQSVLGFYAIWSFVGMAIARAGLAEVFARVVFGAAAGATIVFGLTRLGELRTVPIVGVAHSLYIGYGVLLALFAPRLAPRSRWLNVLLGCQIIVLAASLVRSIWFAFPLALVGTVLVCRPSRHVLLQMIRLLALAAVVLGIAAFAYPPAVASVAREAASIVNYNSGSSASDNNAKWRLTNWHYGLSEIQKHPLGGIGFGQSEVPQAVCAAGCNKPGANGDATVLSGADLHNSILAIPLRLGLPGLFVFLMFEAMVLQQARRSAFRSKTVAWLFACHLLTLLVALTAVVLEGPYMGIFFWLFGGLVIGAGSAPGASGAAPEPVDRVFSASGWPQA